MVEQGFAQTREGIAQLEVRLVKDLRKRLGELEPDCHPLMLHAQLEKFTLPLQEQDSLFLQLLKR